MARKEFKYKGFTLDQLSVMSMDQLVGIMPARVRRGMKRGFTDSEKKLMANVRDAQRSLKSGKKPKALRTHCRMMPILPDMVGLSFEVYNGKEFVKLEVIPDMIGQYIGEFAITTKPVKHNAPGVGATRSSLFVPIK